MNDPSAVIFGLAGLAGQIIWPGLKMRRTILVAQCGTALCYATHYALLDQMTGAGVCLIGATQTLTTLIVGDRPWMARLPICFIPVIWILGILTWSGPATAFAVAACTLVMLGRMQRDMLKMRAVMLTATPFGIGHDLIAGALPALVGALISAVVAIAALRREMNARGVQASPGTPNIPSPA